ncbi:uncharacterized protein FIBRA_07378 [Fibroporia radiculosa]|uniref:Uncharacterized protein n=1 Tax=Fibroporia radiculosa TaxID=599839 RepID=J4H4K9_9APHY|nr:uncharacterized protein FIBRA_07378 [Fibroporia radiculosa]CCM05169.1 predicted protein [Fibroporia radiculosa]
MAYPIQWLDATFNSRTKTEDLLRPDLESGLISQHDFQLAVAFLPASHRYWPYGYALLGSSAAAGYARLYRRPPVSLNRTMIIATAAGFIGSVYGQFRRAKAHWAFTHVLEDPIAFNHALENVNKRTGGVRPLAWTIQTAKEVQRPDEMHGNAPRPIEDTWAPDADQASQSRAPIPTSTPKSAASPEAPSRPASRWQEIRAANSRGAGLPSSWDVLRQTHERSRLPDDAQSTNQPPMTDRAREQAQFDALLEAERRIAGG